METQPVCVQAGLLDSKIKDLDTNSYFVLYIFFVCGGKFHFINSMLDLTHGLMSYASIT